MIREGGFYQIKGPFTAGQNALSDFFSQEGATSAKVRVGISLDTKDWIKLQDFAFTITGTTFSAIVQMGRTCMYQTDQGAIISSIVFNQDAPASTIINLVGC